MLCVHDDGVTPTLDLRVEHVRPLGPARSARRDVRPLSPDKSARRDVRPLCEARSARRARMSTE